jgi:hypothetical protein
MVSLIVLAVSCGADDGTGQGAAPAAASATGDPSSDKLAQILARGTVVLSTDPEYPPPS